MTHSTIIDSNHPAGDAYALSFGLKGKLVKATTRSGQISKTKYGIILDYDSVAQHRTNFLQHSGLWAIWTDYHNVAIEKYESMQNFEESTCCLLSHWIFEEV